MLVIQLTLRVRLHNLFIIVLNNKKDCADVYCITLINLLKPTSFYTITLCNFVVQTRSVW